MQITHRKARRPLTFRIKYLRLQDRSPCPAAAKSAVKRGFFDQQRSRRLQSYVRTALNTAHAATSGTRTLFEEPPLDVGWHPKAGLAAPERNSARKATLATLNCEAKACRSLMNVERAHLIFHIFTPAACSGCTCSTVHAAPFPVLGAGPGCAFSETELRTQSPKQDNRRDVQRKAKAAAPFPGLTLNFGSSVQT